jgi:hypothetical protein
MDKHKKNIGEVKEQRERTKTEVVPLEFDLHGTHYAGLAKPLTTSCDADVCYELDVTLNGKHLGNIYCGKELKWMLRGSADQELVDKIGEIILLWYE